jgi:Protein of unknown function (DUF1501)
MTPNGYAWRHFRLWENACVLHGIDQGTAAHLSGIISAMSGAPGGEYRAPAMQAVVAQAMYERFGDNERVLPSVALNASPDPNPYRLPSRASPVHLTNIDGLTDTLSTRGGQWSDAQRGMPLRDVADFEDLALSQSLPSSSLDDRIRARLRKMKGRSTSATDSVLHQLYDGIGGISKVLAKDVMTILANTPGTEHITNEIHWGVFNTPYGVSISTNDGDSGPSVDAIELALKLLKSNLTSSITLRLPGVSGYHFDTHGFPVGDHFVNVWAAIEEAGRLLGEMKSTPVAGGKTLLDDTLVVMLSDFARTWPDASDHWPTTSVVLLGGGIETNRMIGNYDVANFSPYSQGYLSSPVDVLNLETRVVENRAPKSADVVATILKTLGINEFFIPGGYGEIVGARRM